MSVAVSLRHDRSCNWGCVHRCIYSNIYGCVGHHWMFCDTTQTDLFNVVTGNECNRISDPETSNSRM
jgi:hypothetical protein